jgi:hypothetical protein
MDYNLKYVALLSILYISYYYFKIFVNLVLIFLSLFFLISILISLYSIYKLKQFGSEKRNFVMQEAMNVIVKFLEGRFQLNDAMSLYQMITS